jgi:hypothetical protein
MTSSRFRAALWRRSQPKSEPALRGEPAGERGAARTGFCEVSGVEFSSSFDLSSFHPRPVISKLEAK